MPAILKNNASSTLATAATASDTAIVVADGSQFPALSSGEYFYATLVSPTGTVEVIKATARASNSLTVVRAQDGTSAASFQVGSRVEMRVNAETVRELRDVIAATESSLQAEITATENSLQAEIDANALRNETFASRAALVAAWSDERAPNGSVISDGKVQYFASAGATTISDLPGLLPLGQWSVRHFGAVLNDSTDDTLTIQAAINALHAAGGGELVIDGNTVVSLSSESDTFLLTNTPPTPNSTELASNTVCIVLRSGVTLVLEDNARIRSSSTTPSVIAPVDMNGGGIVGRNGRGRITSNWTTSGPGHGILLRISEDGQDNINLTFDNLEIYQVGSYGIGAGLGDYANNRYSNLYIHDTGADGIDHKVRNGSENISRGVTFENIVVERQGRRVAASAGIDIRGPATLNNIWVLDYALGTQNNVGIRFSSATYNSQSAREASSYSSMTNFYIDGGDPSISGTEGITLLSSQGTQVGFGTVRNCRGGGLRVVNAASGVGDISKLSNLAMITVEACRSAGATIVSEGVNLLGIRVIGQVDPFSQIRGNLTIGQTVLNTPRPHDISNVQVWKNGTQLTVTTDYVVTDVDTITLVIAAANSDVFEVITPTTVGFDVDGANCGASMCTTEHVTSPQAVAAGAVATYRPGVNRFGGGDIILRGAGDPHIGIVGPDTNYELEIRAKGSGGVTLRSNGPRALRAENPVSAVNYLTVYGSITGQPVNLKPAGTDTNVGIEIAAKGSGIVSLGSGAGAKQVQASATGIGFYETAPIAKPTGVAVSAAGIHAALVSLGLIAP